MISQTISNLVDTSLPEHSAGLQINRQLLTATLPFAKENRRESWRLVLTVFTLLSASLIAAAIAPWPWLQLIFSLLSAMLMVRAFITYHDYLHGAILSNSNLARWLFRSYGLLSLAPVPSWKESHNYHHGHVGKIDIDGVGTFPIMTTEMWRTATRKQRAYYRLQRHPLTILLGYITVFCWSLCLSPFMKKPYKHIEGIIALVLHLSLITLCWQQAGADVAFFVIVLPISLACAFGSYLFFAQHNFKRMTIISAKTWSYYRAALTSSSYLKLNKMMQWFTGNIGYHHIHHLNVRIPFYRLPEVMAAIPELQSPIVTTLALRDMFNCFQSCLWDEKRQTMVSYKVANQIANEANK